MSAHPRIMIGMPVGSGSIPWATAVSLLATIRACDRGDLPVRIESPVGNSVVVWARSAIVGGFLKSQCTHLFWIDSDMVWTPADFLRLVKWGAVYDIIGAAYPFKKDPPEVCMNLPGAEGEREIDGHGNIKINSLPLGFTIVRREAIERLAATKPVVKDSLAKNEYPDVFRISRRDDGNGLGEDIAFYDDLRALGYQPWLDPSINLGHVGQKIYRCDVINSLGLEDYAQEKHE